MASNLEEKTLEPLQAARESQTETVSLKTIAWRVAGSRYLLWLLLALPGIITVVHYVSGTAFYGQVLHSTGELSARLLLLTLAVTPLRLRFPGRRWVAWLVRRRRYFGLAVFGYAVLHTGIYVLRKSQVSLIWSEGLELALLTGWLALFILLPLALTSNDWSVRWLRKGWKRLHRWVHLAAVLIFIHWIMTAFDPLAGVLHLLVLAALEGYRLWHVYLRRPKASTS